MCHCYFSCIANLFPSSTMPGQPSLLSQYHLLLGLHSASSSEGQQTSSNFPEGPISSFSELTNPPADPCVDCWHSLSPTPSPLTNHHLRSDSFEQQEEVKCLKIITDSVCKEQGLEAGTLTKFAEVCHKVRTAGMLTDHHTDWRHKRNVDRHHGNIDGIEWQHSTACKGLQTCWILKIWSKLSNGTHGIKDSLCLEYHEGVPLSLSHSSKLDDVCHRFSWPSVCKYLDQIALITSHNSINRSALSSMTVYLACHPKFFKIQNWPTRSMSLSRTIWCSNGVTWKTR